MTNDQDTSKTSNPPLREMTEKQANEEGTFDCPTCGRLRNAHEMTTEAADVWAAWRGVKIVGTRRKPIPNPDGVGHPLQPPTADEIDEINQMRMEAERKLEAEEEVDR